MKKGKKYMIVSVLILLLILGGVFFYFAKRNYEKNKKTQYLDATMGSVIEHQARMIGINSIEDIYLGYTCYFDTLLDLTKLPNLNSIHITGKFNYWDETPDEPIVPEPPERIQQIENELAEILDKCPNVQYVNIRNTDGTCELTDLEFLTHGNNLINIGLWSMGDIDYSPIYECTNLKNLGVSDCDIEDLAGIEQLSNLERLTIKDTAIDSAKDIVKLKKLTYLDIKGTPLAENEEELEKIREALPDVKIYID